MYSLSQHHYSIIVTFFQMKCRELGVKMEFKLSTLTPEDLFFTVDSPACGLYIADTKESVDICASSFRLTSGC